MSQEHVERTRQAFDAFNRRDLEAFLELTHEEVVVESRLAALEGAYHGHDGVRRWWDNILETFPDFRLESTDASAARDHGDFTLVQLVARAHGGGSATPLNDPVWHAAEWRDGRYIWWRVFQTEAEALAAIGARQAS